MCSSSTRGVDVGGVGCVRVRELDVLGVSLRVWVSAGGFTASPALWRRHSRDGVHHTARDEVGLHIR